MKVVVGLVRSDEDAADVRRRTRYAEYARLEAAKAARADLNIKKPARAYEHLEHLSREPIRADT